MSVQPAQALTAGTAQSPPGNTQPDDTTQEAGSVKISTAGIIMAGQASNWSATRLMRCAILAPAGGSTKSPSVRSTFHATSWKLNGKSLPWDVPATSNFKFEDLSGNNPTSVINHRIEKQEGGSWRLVSGRTSNGARSVSHSFFPSSTGKYRYRIENVGTSQVRNWRMEGRMPLFTIPGT